MVNINRIFCRNNNNNNNDHDEEMVIDEEVNRDENYFEELEWLKQYTPCFRVDAANISVLKEPSEFYRLLLVRFCPRRVLRLLR